MGQFG
jgi:hypothetical protein